MGKSCDKDLLYSTMSTLLQRIDSSLRHGEGTVNKERQQQLFFPLTHSLSLSLFLPLFHAKPFLGFSVFAIRSFNSRLVETYPGLQYLDGFALVKVVLRADVSSATYDKVAVISRGGSGHEPAHAGFVGEGLLTAAIIGDIVASLPIDSIVAGIRGLAGTILVYKVAGAAAAAGLSLINVATEAKRSSEMVGTMGVALTVCTLPGQVTSDRLGPGKMELGLGIHREAGPAVADLQPVDVVVSYVLQQILSTETNYVPITRGERVALMVNGLGGTPIMELMIAAGKAVPKLQLEHGLVVAIEAAANAIINLKDSLNELEGKEPLVKLDHQLEELWEEQVGSSIQFFKEAYSQLKASSHFSVTSKQWARSCSFHCCCKYGGVSAGYRILLNALIPALTILEEKLNSGCDPCTAFILSSELH
ncbi:hypothetical protein VNO77_27183 [Canavalia gladiata]|uniref:DhaK domain-containing protein n=1 Tax=Canavalia gladiata TaxID=3824 RepID=A0AAN9KTN5_CANGL